MPVYIKDDETTRLVGELARRTGTSKTDAVRTAVKAELDHIANATPFAERLAAFHAAHVMPKRTGLLADKAFFDGLSGEGR